MTLEELRTFLAIAALGSFSRAAQQLHRSQPAISRRLEMLEHELGTPLFERFGPVVRLTEAGGAFQPHAEAALAAVQDGRDAVRDLEKGERGTVSIAMVGTLVDAPILGELRQFGARKSQVRLEIRTASSRKVTELVRLGEATLGLRYYVTEGRELVSLNAGNELMIVVAAPDHRLVGLRIDRTRLLAGERWLGFPPAQDQEDSSKILARQLTLSGLDGADLTFIDSLTAQKRMVQAGFGLALVPESSVRDEIRRGTLATLDIPRMRTTVPITAIHRRGGYLSRPAKLLLAKLTGGPARRDRRVCAE